MTILDTSVLIESCSGSHPLAPELSRRIQVGNRMAIPALVLYEWLLGARSEAELALQQSLFPPDRIIPFGSAEAEIAAQLYRTVKRPRGREIDLAIAACALARSASIWTLNRKDFADIPGLLLS
jgi:predicted nucleic acid-binding protein